MKSPRIVKIEVEGFTWDVEGIVHARAFHFDPTSTLRFNGGVLRIYADNGVVGEYAAGSVNVGAVAALAQRYLGQNPLDRERFYQAMKASSAMAAYDIALWDWAGKLAGVPVHQLIGGYRTEVPGYASTIDGAVTGPLSTPESFGEFAEECLEMGYRGFKMHPFAWVDVKDHVEAILAIGRHVGGKMDMMVDPYCLFQTFADTLKVGWACDEAGFYWLEDPQSDGGVTPFSYARLREMIRTPLLQGEQVDRIEERMALVLAGATDFARADIGRHGLTGSLKLAHAAECVGMDIEPHRSGPAELQFLGAVKNANYYEIVWVHPIVRNSEPPIYTNVNITGLDCIDKNGMVQIPTGPGLGIEYDWDFIKAHSTGIQVLEL